MNEKAQLDLIGLKMNHIEVHRWLTHQLFEPEEVLFLLTMTTQCLVHPEFQDNKTKKIVEASFGKLLLVLPQETKDTFIKSCKQKYNLEISGEHIAPVTKEVNDAIQASKITQDFLKGIFK